MYRPSPVPTWAWEKMPKADEGSFETAKKEKAGITPGLGQSSVSDGYEHPLVLPHVSHFKHVPLRTMV